LLINATCIGMLIWTNQKKAPSPNLACNLWGKTGSSH
jgi:hypothetical protein